MRREILTVAIALGALSAACADATTSPAPVSAAATRSESARPGDEPGCTFDRGTTTCTTTTAVTEVSTHQTFSGCLAGPPPFRPGARVTTFEDTWLVTTSTTTSRHGRAGAIYDTQTSETRELISSRQVSSVCEAF